MYWTKLKSDILFDLNRFVDPAPFVESLGLDTEQQQVKFHIIKKKLNSIFMIFRVSKFVL